MATTPVYLPGKFHGQKSLAGDSPWDHKEQDVTEHAHKVKVYVDQKETKVLGLKLERANQGSVSSL